MNENASAIGVIFGNRDFFPDKLVTEARADVAKLFESLGLKAIMLSEDDTKLGGVETHADARKCAELFKAHRDEISGVYVCLPNFGDEKGVADTLKLAGLNVPVLVQGYPDDLDRLDVIRRRDAFCGKISVCNNLRQAGIAYSLTEKHVVRPDDPSFIADLEKFVAVCRVVRGIRGCRIGAVGARPGAFNTVRYSEKILERNGISVTTVDLSEILGSAEKLAADDRRVVAKTEEIKAYANASLVPADKLTQMARLGVVLDDFVEENGLDATAIQCWTSVQANHGCNVCTSMSMMSEELLPSACEVDVTGTLTMYAMQLASGSPSALVDWNNNYGSEDDKCVLFHCGNWAKSFLKEAKIATAPILGTVVGEENTYGALDGRSPASALTYGRITTDDTNGRMRAYVGEGRLTDDKLNTFGNRAVAEVPKLQKLMRHVCREGFEHHVVMNASHTATVLKEAFETYLGWETYYHEEPGE
ncbi:L-fucose/L-arabinose isomerase family protein [Pelagicoccus sp. SDUM812002]|uniref:L-fucose/L-arabinose isomerase family protein n=1 Tax=Pelagicoccus sp. SDUM812002 TaxID=3041266 RepID=UPI00280D1F0B|nr:L-fucose/L-arabinose isomerase family protein [Pelagicoccus sp. SDUM812002]MDQ8187663.1 L-fucose/L-arabinose isomerase family protein [Pelagicoccus sp. SDUM812002]